MVVRRGDGDGGGEVWEVEVGGLEIRPEHCNEQINDVRFFFQSFVCVLDLYIHVRPYVCILSKSIERWVVYIRCDSGIFFFRQKLFQKNDKDYGVFACVGTVANQRKLCERVERSEW